MDWIDQWSNQYAGENARIKKKDCTQKKTKKVLAILCSLGYTKRAVTW